MVAVVVAVRPPDSSLMLGCKPTAEPDGCFWNCANCHEVCLRVSFGTMNGCYRCKCGYEVVVFVDGNIIDLREFATDLIATPETVSPENDEEFLKEMGISNKESS